MATHDPSVPAPNLPMPQNHGLTLYTRLTLVSENHDVLRWLQTR